RAGRRGHRRNRGAAAGAGVPARAAHVPSPVHRRGRGRGVHALLLPAAVALRRAAGPRLPQARRRGPRPAPGGGGRAGQVEARARRALAAREHAPGPGALPAGRGRRPAEPLEHAAGPEGPRLVRRLAPVQLTIFQNESLRVTRPPSNSSRSTPRTSTRSPEVVVPVSVHSETPRSPHVQCLASP